MTASKHSALKFLFFDICCFSGALTGESQHRSEIWCKAGNSWRSRNWKQGI